MYQEDLFYEPDMQDVLRDLMQKSWDEGIQMFKDRGEIPPWVEADTLLQEDEIRLLQAIGDGYDEGDKVTVRYDDGRVRHVSKITRDAGFNAEVNAVAVINRCMKLGYIERIVCGVQSTLFPTEEGLWRLDAVMADRYWEEDYG